MKTSIRFVCLTTALLIAAGAIHSFNAHQATTPHLKSSTPGETAQAMSATASKISSEAHSLDLSVNPPAAADLSHLRELIASYRDAANQLAQRNIDDDIKTQLNRRDLPEELRKEYFGRIHRLIKLREALLNLELQKIDLEYAASKKRQSGAAS